MLDERIKRINELAKKSREVGLSDDEKQEQQRLRQEYIAAFRQSLDQTLDQVFVVEENGEAVPVKEHMRQRRQRGEN